MRYIYLVACVSNAGLKVRHGQIRFENRRYGTLESAFRRGNWCAFVVKLGAAQVDAAVDSLLRMRDRLELNTVGDPGTLGVIVGSGYGYKRPDGISVIPVAALGP